MTRTGFTLLAGLLSLSLAHAAEQIDLSCGVAHRALIHGQKQTTYVKVGLVGFGRQQEAKRAPVNVAIVLDKSGSMTGDKLKYAKEAAKMALQRLNANDVVSLITYDSTIHVIVPATKLSDRSEVYRAIDGIRADGSTALFGGVTKGAAEVRKFFDERHINRIILLSDGQANVGPKTPGELGELGRSLIKEGISVTTLGLGLGYNEDLMAQLANTSDGTHRFIQEPQELVEVFDQEFGSLLCVVAQQVKIEIECLPGTRPVRVLGREAEIAGQKVSVFLNQLYSQEEKYVLLEVEVAPGELRSTRELAKVQVAYLNLASGLEDQLSAGIGVDFTDDESEVRRSRSREVMISTVMQIATDNNEEAMRFRDAGMIEKAKQSFLSNQRFLEDNNLVLQDENLQDYYIQNGLDAANLEAGKWAQRRKQIRQIQGANRVSQRTADYSQQHEDAPKVPVPRSRERN